MAVSAPIVLLHAMGASHRMWRAQVEALGDRYEVLAPDLPGHGATGGRFTLAAAVAQVEEMLRDRASPAHLVGASLGANVALRVALDEPRLAASLVLSGAAVRMSRAGVTIQRAVTAVLPLSVTSEMSATIVRPADDRDRVAFVEDIRRAGKRTQADALRELRRDDLEPRLGDVHVPALVCCGAGDASNLASARLLAARLPDATLRVVPDGGHLWNLQQPDLCTRTVEEFVSAVGEAR